MQFIFSILYFSFFTSFSSINTKSYSDRIDSSFINWNKCTFKSLERQLNNTNDEKDREMFLNRLLAFHAFLDVESVDTINHQSIRYKFLKVLFHKKKYKNFYIVEANLSGESVLLRNFVVYKDFNNITVIDFYIFINGEWKKIGNSKVEIFLLNTNLKKYILKFPSGYNHDDIIITQFDNEIVVTSEYYLYRTLSSLSGVQRILDTYKKENFYK